MKKKTIIIILIGIIIAIYFFTNSYAYTEVNYRTTVITSNKTTLYKKKNNKYIEVGSISKGTLLKLNKNYGRYFSIKNTNYYVLAKDVNNSDDYYENNSYDKYIPLGSIYTNPTYLYKYDDIIFEINEEMKFDILAKDDTGFYVKYLNDIYLIKDNYKTDLLSNDYLDNMNILVLKEKDNSALLKEINKKFYVININDFNLWLNGNINLPSNSILLLYDSSNFYQNFDFSNALKKVNLYYVDDDFTIDKIIMKISDK